MVRVPTERLEVRLLGPLMVLLDGVPVELPPLQRAALIPLALKAGHKVSEVQLMQSVYGHGEYYGTNDPVMRQVSRVRTQLGRRSSGGMWIPDSVRGSGLYVLDVPRSAVDALAFEDGYHRLDSVDATAERIDRSLRLLESWRDDPIETHQRYLKDVRALFKHLDYLRRRLEKRVARDLLDVGEFDEAEHLIDGALRARPEDAELVTLLSELHRARRGGNPLPPNSTPRPQPAAQARPGLERSNSLIGDLEARTASAIAGLPSLVNSAAAETEAALDSVMASVAAEATGDEQVAGLLSFLAQAYPAAVAVSEFEGLLGPVNDEFGFDLIVRSAISRANGRLMHVTTNQLNEFRVTLSHSDSEPVTERLIAIAPIEVASLLAKSPIIGNGLPTLQSAIVLYDAGAYTESLERLVRVCQDLAQGQRMSATHMTLFFYFLSKCLLKLNLDEPLVALLDGRYAEFTSSLCPELESERLQVAGVLHRQRDDLIVAAATLDEAVEHLAEVGASSRQPVIFRALADAEVLRIHPRLDRAVRDGPQIPRQAALRFASEAIERAHAYLRRFWEESGETTHYEGRLHGTRAFVHVARSIVYPATVRNEDWTMAVTSAHAAFEPEHARKPVGIVAGRAALAAVHTAHAVWLRREHGDERSAMVAVDLAAAALEIADAKHVPLIELGQRFEARKLASLRANITALQRPGDTTLLPDALTPIL